jgi:deoxyribodipyrimidine photolyase
LRLEDNAALYHALRSGNKVLCLFIFDKNILDKLEDKNDRRVNFIHRAIGNLKATLQQHQSDLMVAYGKCRRVQTEGKYWTSLLDDKVKELKEENIVPIITDVRYIEYKEDEYSWIKSHNGILIHLSRKLDDGSLVPPANIEEKSNDNKLKAVADFAICWETCQDTNFLYELIQKNLRNIYDRLTANSKDQEK